MYAYHMFYSYFLNGLIIAFTFFVPDVLALTSLRKFRWPCGIISQMQSSSNAWFVTAQNGFFIRDVYDPYKKRILNAKTMLITNCTGGIAINGIPIAQKSLIIMPRTSAMVINGVLYKGMARVMYKKGVVGLQVVGPSNSKYGEQKLHSLGNVAQSFRDSSQQLLVAVSKNLQSIFDSANLRTFDVRVLLSEWNSKREGLWSFYSPKGFIIGNLESKKKTV